MAFLNPELLIKQIPFEEGMSVADLGAGGGAFTLPIARRVGARGHVYAVDINPDLLSLVKTTASREGLSNVEIIKGDFERPEGTGLARSSVGLVVFGSTLFQAGHKEEAVKEGRRILLPKGFALAVDWKESFGGLGPLADHVISEDAVQKLFLHSGFALYNKLDAGDYHYGFLFRKL